jgi:hypothetical protein
MTLVANMFNPKIIITFIIAGILLLVAMAFSGYMSTSYPQAGSTITITQSDSLLSVNSTIVEVVNGHAWVRHGVEVNAAFRCLNNNGSARSFKTFGMVDETGKPLSTNLWLCQDGNDWYAIITTTLEKVGGNRIGRLITAYLVDKIKFPTIDSFITAITDQWRAISINFIIEAGSVFLQPK